jgi:hypothetical protein
MLFSFLTVFGQNENDLPQRQPYKLKLPVDKNFVYEMDVPESPYVVNRNIVQIYPGETIYLEAETSSDTLVLTSVKEIKYPEKTIVISCTQTVNKGKHERIILKVTNPFDKPLLYSATMFLMKTNKWVQTDVLPVEPKIASFEMWPDIVVTFGLSDWRLSKK